jgi:hypothetical protein
MRRIATVAGALLLVAACAGEAPARRYSGIYEISFERQAFIDDASGEAWWVTLSYDAQEAMNAAKPRGNSFPFGWRIRVEVEGALSGEGEYGHLGAYKRHIAIARVISAKLEAKPVRE